MKTNQQDLILKMLDGSETGQLVPIQVEQCLLGTDPQCAIIRTPDGVQAQCTKGLMLINDVETKVKWLTEGDAVTLGDSTFEIAELGHISGVETNDNAVEDSTPSHAGTSNSVDGRIKEFESLLNEQQEQHLVQNEALEERLAHITLQLESLCDHLLDFEDRIEEQKLLTQQAIEKQQLVEHQVAAQPDVSPVASELAAIGAPVVEEFATEPLAAEVTATEPVVTEQVDARSQVEPVQEISSDTVVFADENQTATEAFTDLLTANKTEESFLPIEESVPETVSETENSLLESLGLSADQTTDGDTAQPEVSESAVAASELDLVFGAASQQPESNLESTQSLEQEAQPAEEVSTEIGATDTSELDSLLSSLQNDDQDAGNQPALDVDGGLGALENRIAETQASLSNDVAEFSSPATELNSLFDSLGTESSKTTEPAPSQEPPEEKPVNESVADVLARMNPDGNTSWDEEESSNGLSSAAEPVLETETTTFAATDESVPPVGVENAEGEGNVDDYMSALLQRLKSGPDSNSAPAPKKAVAAAGATASATPVQPATPEPVKMPKLKPEEFVPKSVAKVQTNKIAEMRALANQSATNSVANCNIKRNKEKTLGLQIGSLIGLFSGIILFLVSHRIFDLFFILAIASTAIGAACLYMLYGRKKPKTAAFAHAEVRKVAQNEKSEQV